MLGYRELRGLEGPRGDGGGGEPSDPYSQSACFTEQQRPSPPTVTHIACLEGATKATDTTSELTGERGENI